MTAAPARAHGLDAALCLGLFAMTLALFAPLRHHEFLNYDDPEYVTENPVVRRGLTLDGARWALTSRHQATWHPLTSLSHLVDVSLFGLDAGAHLLVNVVLHGLATVVLFLALYAMTQARWPSAWVAALFAWHPLHVESVAWVAERKDVLSGLFWMLTLAAYVAYTRRPGRLRFGLVMLVFALGLLAKPMLVTLPVILLALDYWPLGRTGRAAGNAPLTTGALLAEKIPLLVLALAVSIVTVVVQAQAGAITTLASAPLGFRIGNALVAYVTYLRKMMWPVDLAVFYPTAIMLSGWRALAAGAFLAAVSVVLIAHGRRRPAPLVGWLWYVVALLPVSGIIRQGEQAMADRFTYLPLIGIFIAIAWGVPALVPTSRGRSALAMRGQTALAMAATAALVACLVVSSRQIRHWENSIALFGHALAVTSDNYVAHLNLGSALAARGDRDLALQHYRAALTAMPGYAEGHLNVGRMLAERGEHDAALREYAEAVRLKPSLAIAEYNWGSLLAERGALAEAAPHYQRALALDPSYAKAANNLGWALAQQGQLEAAVERYRQALRIAPDLTAAHNGLAVALEGLGRDDEALAEYAAAVRLAPDEPRARANYAAVLAGRGRTAEAIAEYRAAVRLAPTMVAIRVALAAALAAHGEEAAAAGEYRAALATGPASTDAMQGLAWLLATARDAGTRDAAEAVRVAESAVAATGRTDPGALDTLGAAYAASGRFEDAAATAEQALALARAADRQDLVATLDRRLARYRAKEPAR